MCRTDLVALLEKARIERKEITAAESASGQKDATENTGVSSTLQGAAALDPAVDGGSTLGLARQARLSVRFNFPEARSRKGTESVLGLAEIERPQRFCLNCKTPSSAQADNLSACRGCRKVRTLFYVIIALDQKSHLFSTCLWIFFQIFRHTTAGRVARRRTGRSTAAIAGSEWRWRRGERQRQQKAMTKIVKMEGKEENFDELD